VSRATPARGRGRPAGGDGAATRQAIIDGAARCFGQHGYDAASIRLIAQDAGLTSAAIYNHFSSKAELFASVFEHADRLLEDALRAADHDAGTEAGAVPRLAAVLLAAARHAEAQPAMASFMVAAPLEVVHSEELQAVLPLIDGALFRVLHDVVADGQARGELRADVEASLLARVASVFLVGVATHLTVHGGAGTVEPEFPQAVLMVLRSGLTDEGPPTL
jgi:AcrR family transcriptional regulator